MIPGRVMLEDTKLDEFFVRCILADRHKIKHFQDSRPIPKLSREGTSMDPRRMNPETPEENPLEGLSIAASASYAGAGS